MSKEFTNVELVNEEDLFEESECTVEEVSKKKGLLGKVRRPNLNKKQKALIIGAGILIGTGLIMKKVLKEDKSITTEEFAELMKEAAKLDNETVETIVNEGTSVE